MTICRNLALDKNRKMVTHSQSIDEASHDTPDYSYASNPEEQTIQHDRIMLVQQLMDSLPEKQRTVMLLRETEGKSYKEIAQVMDISEEQVKVNLFRARQTIKQRYLETDNYGL